MRKPWIIAVLIFLFLMGLLVYIEHGLGTNYVSAQDGGQAAQGETANSPENEIREILENYYRLAGMNDREALKNFSRRISAPEYKFSSELGKLDKKAVFLRFDSMNIEFISAEFDDLSIQVHGDTAIAKYLDNSVVRVNGDLTRTPMRFTNVWLKRDGRWQIVAEHSSLITPSKLLPPQPLPDNVAGVLFPRGIIAGRF